MRLNPANSINEGTSRNLPSVCVLLSLYNGKRFLREQVESLARQRGVAVHVEARDDGSQDGSAELLEALCGEFGLPCRVERAANKGVQISFFELMERDLTRFDCAAFCDQDDVWKADKLMRAVAALAPYESVPALYCTSNELTDISLNVVGRRAVPRRIGFGNALVENVVQGATAVLNRAALELIRSIGRPKHSLMHDWWAYLAMSAFGFVIYDRYPSILYRQHGGNFLGSGASFWRLWRRRLSGHFGIRARRMSVQVADFADLAGARLTGEARTLLDTYLQANTSVRRRIALAFDRRIWRNAKLDDIAVRLLILLGRH